MNDILKEALKDVPVTKTDLPISSYGSVDLDELNKTVERLNKIPNMNDLVKENNKLQSNWNSLREENKALRLLLNWAEECDWGFDNFRDDDVIDWEEFEEESEDMDYIESMIYYAKKYLDKMNKIHGKKY